MNNFILEDEYFAGSDAFKKGLSIKDCPHTRFPEKDWWEEGYEDAARDDISFREYMRYLDER